MFIGTYAKIQSDLGEAPATVSKVMKKLQETGFIKKFRMGYGKLV